MDGQNFCQEDAKLLGNYGSIDAFFLFEKSRHVSLVRQIITIFAVDVDSQRQAIVIL